MENDPLNELAKLYLEQYVSHSDLADFKTKYAKSLPDPQTLKRQKLKSFLSLNFKTAKKFQKLYDLLENRDKLNQEFIKREQAKKYQIEGNDLDSQQIAAVVATEDAELILAPAGSGKTASLLAKLNYLTDYLQIPPDQILVIAFTNKVVAELKDRVKQTNVEIRTFHSLGNKIAKQKLKNHRLIADCETRQFFHQYIIKKQLTAKLPKTLDSSESPEALFVSVLSLQKNERIDLAEYYRRLDSIKNPASRQNALEFYALYAPAAEAYAKHLQQNHLYDFADMLNLATDFVQAMPKNSFSYQYILVDEAQDLSTSKYLLLKAILEKCQKVKLFAVGDDWQSIYRFAGSNLHVLDDFEKIFGRTTHRGLIELTYRFGQPTAKISNKFIQKNPHQSRKKVVPHVDRKTPIIIKLNPATQPKTIPPDYVAVDQILQSLYQKHGPELFRQKIQIISRYNRDVFRLVDETSGKYRHAELKNFNESQMELTWQLNGATKKLSVPFCSMHKAKGITRDIIIIINANSGSHGIPATRANDSVTEVLLTKLDAYPHAEERRLWYVAITRAKQRTFIVSDPRRISPFVFEISPRLKGAGVKVCPKCHRGIMIERRRKDGKIYYSCSNFAGGCRHTEQ
ncbi:UvrD-helicase domain-containing protein [Candidatus Saccharibacteria bacterium]|nr:UvrD-helicase domain-containing protein [Candidatus Saccharibacteria bacterium]